MNVLVTGGAGFIGSHVAESYLRLGHKVWVVDDLSTGRRENVPAGAQLCPWDIADWRVAKLLSEEKIVLVNHHAAHMDLRESVTDPVKDARINVLGLISLLEVCRSAGTRRFIFASTGGAIYGEQKKFPAPENHPVQPDSPYGVSKLAGEKYLEYYWKSQGLIPQVLRYANVYGPRQNPHGEAGVVAIFTQRMLRGQIPTIHGSGEQTRDFVYIADVVHANVLALQNPQPCLFNVGTGKETSVLSIFSHLKELIHFSSEATHDEAKKGEQMRSCIDSAALKKAWGWKTETSLTEGLSRTVQWFREQAIPAHVGK